MRAVIVSIPTMAIRAPVASCSPVSALVRTPRFAASTVLTNGSAWIVSVDQGSSDPLGYQSKGNGKEEHEKETEE
jgi:hypothetical protein